MGIFGHESTRHIDREINRKLDLVLCKLDAVSAKEDNIMALEDDLNGAVTSLATAFEAEHNAVQIELQALADAIAQGGAGLKNAAQQAIANIQAITGKMAADAAALTASVPAATTVPTPDTHVIDTPATPTADVPVIATPPITAGSASQLPAPDPSATTQSP